MIVTAKHALPKPVTRSERQAEMRHRLAANANRRWREKRIAEGKNPNASLLDVFAESLEEAAREITKTLNQPSAVYRMTRAR